MTVRLFAAGPAAGNETFVEIMNVLCGEILAASARDASIPGLSYYAEFRSRITVLLANVLEDEIGLRFGETPMPFCGLARRVLDEGGPLGGYVAGHPDYLPHTWVTELFVRWLSHQQARWKWGNAGSSYNEVLANAMHLEGARLIRAALWHCMGAEDRNAVPVAVRFVAEVTSTGQARDSMGAALAISTLLRAGTAADDPESLVRLLFGGSFPETAEDWTTGPLSWSDPPPGPLARSSQQAVSWLLLHAQSMAERARRAEDFDSWAIALTTAEPVFLTIVHGLSWAMAEIPLGLRTVRTQFEELHADANCLLLAAHAGMPSAVAYSLELAERFRRLGDSTGQRFARERLLIPPGLLDTSKPLPPAWSGPTWRIATAWCRDSPAATRQPPGGARNDLTLDDVQTATVSALSQVDRLLTKRDTPRRVRRGVDIAKALVRGFPWSDRSLALRSLALQRAGHAPDAVRDAMGAIVLYPHKLSHWILLGEALLLSANPTAARVAYTVSQAISENQEWLAAGLIPNHEDSAASRATRPGGHPAPQAAGSSRLTYTTNPPVVSDAYEPE